MRTLTSAISDNYDADHNQAVYVVEIKSGSTVLVRASNWGDIDDWDGAGENAFGVLVTCPVIRQTLDWRGGLAFFAEPSFEIADEDGTIMAALRGSMDLDIEVWFLLVDGAISKSTQAIQIYAGVVAGFSIAGNVVTVQGGDYRARRYPRKVLSEVVLSNEENLCGAGLQQTAIGTWGTTLYFQEKWLPEKTKGNPIPITINRPDRCKLLWVSSWPGAETLGASYDIRGPLFVLSDLKLDYGSGLIGAFSTDNVYRVETVTGELSRRSGYNSLRGGTAYEVTGPWPALCVARTTGATNAGRQGCINFYERVFPHNRDEAHANLSGDWASFFDRENSWAHHHLRWTGAVTSGERTVIFKVSFRDSRFPAAAQRFRHVYIEAFVEMASGTPGSGFQIVARHTRNEDWSGDSDDWLDDVVLIDSSDSEFNNVDGEGGSQTWADGNVDFGGDTSPFADASSTLGPQPLDTCATEQLGLELKDSSSPSSWSGNLDIWQIAAIYSTDFRVEDVADQLAADCNYSFDNYYFARTGSTAYCRVYESIVATMIRVFGLSISDISFVSASGWHDAMRLDAQLLSQTTGRDLLDKMAMQGRLWLYTDDSGKEAPLFLDRTRARASVETSMDADFDELNVASGSLTIEQGGEDDLYNQFRVKYKKNYFGGGYLEEAFANESDNNCSVSGLGSTVEDWCSKSQARHGVTRELVFEADLVQDQTAAEYLLQALAAQLVDRPWILRFRTTLEGVVWQLGDFPCVAHARWLAVAEKSSYETAGTLSVSFEAVDASYWKFVVSDSGPGVFTEDSDAYQVGDWIFATSGSESQVVGWYRLLDVSVGSELELTVAKPSWVGAGPYGVDSVRIYPAMMVTSQEISGGSVEIELTEIPRHPGD